jgi:glycosyltransferase involved in cell wall biosynthesis
MPIRVLYYIPGSDLSEREELYQHGVYRGEMVYGAFQLSKQGLSVVQIKPLRNWQGKCSRMWYALFLLLKSRHYDVIYSPYYSGLEYAIKLRGLGLFPKKIMIWHHNPVEKETSAVAKWTQKWFYRGCDALLFFSDVIREESLLAGLNIRKKSFVLNWGPDMSFYDRIRQPYQSGGNIIMSGLDSRDFNTLLLVCEKMSEKHFTVIPPDDETARKFMDLKNVTVKVYPKSFENYYNLALETAKSSLVLILTKPVEGRKLPSGLTSICEAVGLAKPCVITKNRYFSQELLHAGFAAFVEVGDVDGICKQINVLAKDEETCSRMSNAALTYARQYDINNMSLQLADIIKRIIHK